MAKRSGSKDREVARCVIITYESGRVTMKVTPKRRRDAHGRYCAAPRDWDPRQTVMDFSWNRDPVKGCATGRDRL